MNWDDIIIDAAATDTGMRRSNNQDSHAVVRASNAETWRQRGHLFMVADGMGAHAVGELASKMACDNIPHNYTKTKTGTPAEAITKAYREVGALIHGRATANRDFQGMGTTCSTLLLLPAGGPDRPRRRLAGLPRPRRPDRPALVRPQPGLGAGPAQPPHARAGASRRPQERHHPEPRARPDGRGRHRGAAGRRARRRLPALLRRPVRARSTDPEIGAFAANFHPKDACRYLVHLANLRGGHDNITVVILRVGPWVDPDATGEATDGRRRRGLDRNGEGGGLAERPDQAARLGRTHAEPRDRGGAPLSDGRMPDRRATWSTASPS